MAGLHRRWEDSGDDMQIKLLPRGPLRAPGNGESAWAACKAGTRVCAAKAKHGPYARTSRELGKSHPWRLTGTEQIKKENRD
jgi:hypothetical protein